MEREDVTGDGFHPPSLIVQGNAQGVSRTFNCVSAPCMVHENAAHHLGGDRQEVRPILPVNPLMVDQPQIGLVNERRRLERVVAPLPAQLACRARPQVSMDQIEQIVARLNVSARPRAQQ